MSRWSQCERFWSSNRMGSPGRQTSSKVGTAGNLEGDALFCESPLGTNDALGDGGLRDKESTCNFVRRQTSQQTKRESNARFGGENRMTGDEHEAQEVIANVIVECGVEIRHGHLLRLELAAKLRVLALKPLVSAEDVDRPVLRSGHEPSARIVRDA